MTGFNHFEKGRLTLLSDVLGGGGYTVKAKKCLYFLEQKYFKAVYDRTNVKISLRIYNERKSSFC